MSSAGEAVGLVVMVLGVAVLGATALIDLPGLRPQRGGAAWIAAACYAVAFAAILGGAWVSTRAA